MEALNSKRLSSTNLLSHEDILQQILDQVVLLSDFIRFGAVCKTWHSVFLHKKRHRIEQCNNEVPLLLIPKVIKTYSTPTITPTQDQIFDIFDDEKCYNLTSPVVMKMNSIKREAKVMRMSSYGYVATIIKEKGNIIMMNLNNPITGNIISLPPLEDYSAWGIFSVVLSCNPCIFPDECVVPYSNHECSIGVTRSGGKKWSKFTTLELMETILFYKGKLYALDSATNLLSIDFHFESNCDKCDFQTSVVVENGLKIPYHHRRLYLVESLRGELLMIAKKEGINDLKAYKLVIISDDKKGHWDEIHSLGDGNEVLFLSCKQRNAILCCKCRNLQADSVYFLTGDYYVDSRSGPFYTILVFSLKERQPLCIKLATTSEAFFQPFWINPTLQ